MAGGLGEASAVLQVFTTGAGITKYLLDYAKGVRAAEENIIELGEEIFQTTGTLRDLQALIDSSRNTPRWSDYGERSAAKCATDCKAVIEKLRKVLYKSQNIPVPADFTVLPPVPENLSLFSRAKWPWYEPRLKECRERLSHIKIDIILVHETIRLLQSGAMDTQARKPRVRRDRADSRRQSNQNQAPPQPFNVPGRTDSNRSGRVLVSDADDEYDKEYVEKVVKERVQTLEAEKHRSEQERKKAEDEARAQARVAFEKEEDLKRRKLEMEKLAQEEMKQQIRKEIAEEDSKKAAEAAELNRIKHEAVEQWKRQTQIEEEERKAKLQGLIDEAGLEQVLEHHQLSQLERGEIASELTARIEGVHRESALRRSHSTLKRLSSGAQDPATPGQESGTTLGAPKPRSSVRSLVSRGFRRGHSKASSAVGSIRSGANQDVGEKHYSLSLSKPARFVCALADGQSVSLLNTLDSLVRPTNPHDDSLIDQLLETQSSIGEAFASLQERYQATIREYIQSGTWRKSNEDRLDLLQIKPLYDERRSGFLGRSRSKVCTGVFFVFTVMSERIPSARSDDHSDDETDSSVASALDPPPLPPDNTVMQSTTDAPKAPIPPPRFLGQKMDPTKFVANEQVPDALSESGTSLEPPPKSSMSKKTKTRMRDGETPKKKKLRFRAKSKARSNDSQSSTSEKPPDSERSLDYMRFAPHTTAPESTRGLEMIPQPPSAPLAPHMHPPPPHLSLPHYPHSVGHYTPVNQPGYDAYPNAFYAPNSYPYGPPMPPEGYYGAPNIPQGGAFVPSFPAPYNPITYPARATSQPPFIPRQQSSTSTADPYALVPYGSVAPSQHLSSQRPSAETWNMPETSSTGFWLRDDPASIHRAQPSTASRVAPSAPPPPAGMSNANYPAEMGKESKPEAAPKAKKKPSTRRAGAPAERSIILRPSRPSEAELTSKNKIVRHARSPSPIGSLPHKELEAREAALRNGLFERMHEAEGMRTGQKDDARSAQGRESRPSTAISEQSFPSASSPRPTRRTRHTEPRIRSRNSHDSSGSSSHRAIDEPNFVLVSGRRVRTLSPASTFAPPSETHKPYSNGSEMESAVSRPARNESLQSANASTDKSNVASTRSDARTRQGHAYVETVVESDNGIDEYYGDTDEDSIASRTASHSSGQNSSHRERRARVRTTKKDDNQEEGSGGDTDYDGDDTDTEAEEDDDEASFVSADSASHSDAT